MMVPNFLYSNSCYFFKIIIIIIITIILIIIISLNFLLVTAIVFGLFSWRTATYY